VEARAPGRLRPRRIRRRRAGGATLHVCLLGHEGGTLAWAGLTLRRRTEERSSRWQLKLPPGAQGRRWRSPAGPSSRASSRRCSLHTSGSAGRCGRWRVYARPARRGRRDVPRDRRGRARPRQRPRRTTHRGPLCGAGAGAEGRRRWRAEAAGARPPGARRGEAAFKAVARARRRASSASRVGREASGRRAPPPPTPTRQAGPLRARAGPARTREARRDALEAARTLQNVLGEHQDAVEAEYRLRELAATTRGA